MKRSYFVPTKEAYDTLMEYLERLGCHWVDSTEKLTECDFCYWDLFENCTHISVENGILRFGSASLFDPSESQFVYFNPNQRYPITGENEKKVYHTPTKESYDELMLILDQLGYTWYNGADVTSESMWENYKERTVVYVDDHVSYGSRDLVDKDITCHMFRSKKELNKLNTKYYVKVNNSYLGYVNYNPKTKDILCGTKEHKDYLQTQFTEKEFNELLTGVRFSAILEEVEENE